jgi:hypothetical protein
LNLPVDVAQCYLVCIFVRNDYENPRLTGRIEWSLTVNKRLLHTEDIALSSVRRSLTVALSGARSIEVELELRALRDCEPWHWGWASTTFIDGILLTGSATIITGSASPPILNSHMKV